MWVSFLKFINLEASSFILVGQNVVEIVVVSDTNVESALESEAEIIPIIKMYVATFGSKPLLTASGSSISFSTGMQMPLAVKSPPTYRPKRRNKKLIGRNINP